MPFLYKVLSHIMVLKIYDNSVMYLTLLKTGTLIRFQLATKNNNSVYYWRKIKLERGGGYVVLNVILQEMT